MMLPDLNLIDMGEEDKQRMRSLLVGGAVLILFAAGTFTGMQLRDKIAMVDQHETRVTLLEHQDEQAAKEREHQAKVLDQLQRTLNRTNELLARMEEREQQRNK